METSTSTATDATKGAVTCPFDHHTADYAHDLVAPILSGITCEHMGLEVEAPAQFFDSLMHMIDHGSHGDDGVQSDFDRSWDYIVQVVNDRRAERRDDVISHLVAWEPPFT